MSAPFHYTARYDYFPPTPGAWPCPPREIIYPSSPYYGPAPVVPTGNDNGSPNTPERPLFSGLNSEYPSTPYLRSRRSSWHGSTAPVVPFIPPTPPSPFTNRRFIWDVPVGSSSSAAPPIPAWFPDSPVVPPVPYSLPPFIPSAPSSYVPPTPYTPYIAPVIPSLVPTQVQIHPLLNGETRNEISFDLTLTAFAPHRAVGPEQVMPLAVMELSQPAFYPPVTRLHIVCDAIPDWPVDIGYGDGVQGPPITLGDILVALHKKMHESISRTEWDMLSLQQEATVSQAFTKRCRLDAEMRRMTGNMDYQHVPARQQGVKVVDFLKERSMFRGLVKCEDGTVKMIVSE